MNTNKNMLTRLSNSSVGRALRRIFGDECGQGMMEYVIIATVIAAAAALIFAVWGKGIFKGAESASSATVGSTTPAATQIQEGQSGTKSGQAAAATYQNKFSPQAPVVK